MWSVNNFTILARRLLAIAVLSACTSIFSGCTSASLSSLYEKTEPAFSQIDIRSPKGRTEQLLVNTLEHQIGFFSEDRRYSLDYTLTSASRSTLSVAGSSSTLVDNNMTSSYELTELETGELLTSGKVVVSATSGTITSFYGRDVSSQFANERLAILVAERLYQKLQLYFFTEMAESSTSAKLK